MNYKSVVKKRNEGRSGQLASTVTYTARSEEIQDNNCLNVRKSDVTHNVTAISEWYIHRYNYKLTPISLLYPWQARAAQTHDVSHAGVEPSPQSSPAQKDATPIPAAVHLEE